eukprot:g4119.t1
MAEVKEQHDGGGGDDAARWAGKRVVGIDLGTTNSCVAWWRTGPGQNPGVEVLADERQDDKRTLPSVVAFDSNYGTAGNRAPLVGWAAARLPQRICHAKRLIGRTFQSLSGEDKARLPFEVQKAYEDGDEKGGGESLRIVVQHGKAKLSLLPEDVSGLVLSQLKDVAERALTARGVAKEEGGVGSVAVTHAVVTVPAYFDHMQRLKTKAAAMLAGFEDVELLSEPTAAALAYGLDVAGTKKALVFDLGGGTFDVTLMDIKDRALTVLATRGDTSLGGVDVDTLVMDWCAAEFKRRRQRRGSDNSGGAEEKQGKKRGDDEDDDEGDAASQQKIADLKELLAATGLAVVDFAAACERAKIALTTESATEIRLPLVPSDGSGNSGSSNNNNNNNNNNNSGNSGNSPSSSSASFVCKLTRERLDGMCRSTIFARCMAVVAGVLEDAGVAAADVDEVVPVGGATRMPLLRTMLKEAFPACPDLCTALNPDEVVAEGAAVRAALLGGVGDDLIADVMMMDAVPQSFGVHVGGDAFEPVILRNAAVPAKATKTFRTAVDGQPGVTVEVYEGDSDLCSENRKLAVFNFWIPRPDRGKAGEVEVEVTFDFDESGLLRVSTTSESERLCGAPDGGRGKPGGGGSGGSSSPFAWLFGGGGGGGGGDGDGSTPLIWLVFYLVLLIGLFLWARVHFGEELSTLSNTPDAAAGPVDGVLNFGPKLTGEEMRGGGGGSVDPAAAAAAAAVGLGDDDEFLL